MTSESCSLEKKETFWWKMWRESYFNFLSISILILWWFTLCLHCLVYSCFQSPDEKALHRFNQVVYTSRFVFFYFVCGDMLLSHQNKFFSFFFSSTGKKRWWCVAVEKVWKNVKATMWENKLGNSKHMAGCFLTRMFYGSATGKKSVTVSSRFCRWMELIHIFMSITKTVFLLWPRTMWQWRQPCAAYKITC